MCQSFIGAIGSGASVRFHHMQAYTWAAAIVVLLTGCVEVASVLTEAGTVKLLLRGAPVQKYQSGWLPDTVLHGPSASESEPASLATDFEEYWMAIADLDFVALRTLARSEPEIGFAEGPNLDGGMPPASRNHLVPTAGDIPASIAASSLAMPAAIAPQNLSRSSRPVAGGRPGDHNGGRPDRSERRFRVYIAIPR